jgi:hypothetical protein
VSGMCPSSYSSFGAIPPSGTVSMALAQTVLVPAYFFAYDAQLHARLLLKVHPASSISSESGHDGGTRLGLTMGVQEWSRRWICVAIYTMPERLFGFPGILYAVPWRTRTGALQ